MIDVADGNKVYYYHFVGFGSVVVHNRCHLVDKAHVLNPMC